MSCDTRLDRSFKNVPVLPWDTDSQYVLFSDCHRGNGTHNDNFLKNQHLYFAALRHYYHSGFTYIELGDGDELWENRNMEQIKEIHSDVFWLLSQFYKQNRLYMLYGNHDIVKKYASYARKNCSTWFCTASQCRQPLFPDIRFLSGLVLRNESKDMSLYLTHGHQASLINSSLWPLGCFLVRYLWKPLEQIGILDPTSAAKNYTQKQRTERRLTDWAKKNGRILITGHTHRPMLSSEHAPYLNTGSCVHPRCITCLEIEGHTIYLVKWYMMAKTSGALYVSREELSHDSFLFQRHDHT